MSYFTRWRLTKHTPGGHEHDQKTHGGGSAELPLKRGETRVVASGKNAGGKLLKLVHDPWTATREYVEDRYKVYVEMRNYAGVHGDAMGIRRTWGLVNESKHGLPRAAAEALYNHRLKLKK